MIKINLGKKTGYLFIYFIFPIIDYLVSIPINIILSNCSFYIYLYLMSFGNIFGGLILYLYQKQSVNKKNKINFLGKYVIQKEKNDNGKFKKMILIFFASFFTIFNLTRESVHHFSSISYSKFSRLSSIQIISSTFISIYAFEFKINKHHKISLIIISILLFLSIIVDILFDKHNKLGIIISENLLILYRWICNSFNNCIEKYLFQKYCINTYKILIIEGIFESILSILISILKNPFGELSLIFKKLFIGRLIGLIFLLILDLTILMFLNIYRIYCNVIYTPMARSLIDYLILPIFNIYIFSVENKENDFQDNFYYFLFIEIISIIISVFGCIFNGFIIVNCCGLEHKEKDIIEDIEKKLNKDELKDI